MQVINVADLLASGPSALFEERQLAVMDRRKPENAAVVGQDGTPTALSFSFSVCAASSRALDPPPRSKSKERVPEPAAGQGRKVERRRYMGRGCR